MTEPSKNPPIPEWQNLDRILDVLEKAGCTRGGYVHAAEDVVANAIRDWLRTILAEPEDDGIIRTYDPTIPYVDPRRKF